MPKQDVLQYCVDEANMYRAMAGQPALTRSAAIEAYAAIGAEEDAVDRMPHEHFDDTLDAGVATAELEIPFFSFQAWGGTEGVMAEGFREQAESPTASMTLDGDYTLLGCGVYQSGDEVTVVEDAFAGEAA